MFHLSEYWNIGILYIPRIQLMILEEHHIIRAEF